MHLKNILETKKNLKTFSSGQIYLKKTQKTQITKKNKKKH